MPFEDSPPAGRFPDDPPRPQDRIRAERPFDSDPEIDLPEDRDRRAPMLTAEDRQWGMFAHLSALAGAALGGLTFVGPLIIWMMKKDQSRFVDYHGKEALNFQLNILIYSLVLVAGSFVIGFVTCGLGLILTVPLLMGVMIYGLIMPIIGGLKANEGELYEYPLTFRLIK